MRCLKRNKRSIYLCNRYQDGLIEKYKSPEPLDVNYQATNSEGDLIALGLDFPMYVRIKTDIDIGKRFNAKDRVYIGIKPSEPFNDLCKDANYEVDSDPIISLNVAEITLKKLSGKK